MGRQLDKPGKVKSDDYDSLREVGFTHEEITSARNIAFREKRPVIEVLRAGLRLYRAREAGLVQVYRPDSPRAVSRDVANIERG